MGRIDGLNSAYIRQCFFIYKVKSDIKSEPKCEAQARITNLLVYMIWGYDVLVLKSIYISLGWLKCSRVIRIRVVRFIDSKYIATNLIDAIFSLI